MKLSEKETHFSDSSTVDHFIMRAPYVSAYLHVIDDKPMLKYLDKSDPKQFITQHDVSESIEFFVPEDTRPTWEELQKMVGDYKPKKNKTNGRKSKKSN